MTDLIPLINAIDALLPQTQCTKCGYQGCRPYAEAMAQGDAINKCPPGGAAGIERLAQLLQKPVIPLDTAHGEESAVLTVAFIREAECIGCTKCIQACPVDAILGAAKLMHTVISDICTGCDLCVAPCPVDCIDMIPAAQQQPTAADTQLKKDLSRQRFNRRNVRLQQQQQEKSVRKQARIAFQEQEADKGASAVAAALAAVQEKAAQMPLEEQRARLEKTLAAARERFERADAKVREAARKSPEQLAALTARREDMRFKLTETERKLAALAKPSTATTASSAAQAALEKMQAARNRMTDSERLARARDVLEARIAETQQQIAIAEGEEALFLQEDLERLLKKREELL